MEGRINMESHIESHINKASKTIIYLLLYFFILLFCLTLIINISLNKNSSLLKQTTFYNISNFTHHNNLKNQTLVTSKEYKEQDRTEKAIDNFVIEIKNIKNIKESDGKKENISNLKTAYASWYGPRFYDKETANGELYTKNIVSFAHQKLPFGTKIKFYYKCNTVIAYCNDRGPFIKGREFDLSYKAAKILGLKGVKIVKYEIIDDLEEENIKSYEFCFLVSSI